MKDYKNTDNISNEDWEALASLFSGEKTTEPAVIKDGDISETGKIWEKLGNMDNSRIDIDKAWGKVSAKISEPEKAHITVKRIVSPVFLKAAAVIAIFIAIGSLIMLISEPGSFRNNIVYNTGSEQSNLQINLPDGSTVILNRSSRLTYKRAFGNKNREVELTGEAFFNITPDASKPFIIDAGKAFVEVIGTSFNVITENPDSEVEVFVETGKVVVEEKTGSQSLTLEPGYVGTISDLKSAKNLNKNPNYMAWNTGKLVYKGEKLEVVFSDLKRVYNLNIIADNPSINQLPWTAPIEYQPAENIIQMICLSFGLSYTKDGDVYHLSEK
ncbi:MAG TPA: FecR family protein [Bacteroidales bacterium]|nr:FecR family protein [Bacteroidales bacterium]